MRLTRCVRALPLHPDPFHIRADKCRRVHNRAVHVTLRGKIHERITACQGVFYRVGIAYVGVNEFKARVSVKCGEILRITCVSQLIQCHHVRILML